MIIIGLHGPMRSGKDTASWFIHEWANERGVFAVRRGFADLLKLSAARIFQPDIGLNEALDWVNQFKFDGEMWTFRRAFEHHTELSEAPVEVFREPEFHITGRQFLQHYGTECHREVFGDDFWVDQLLPTDSNLRMRRLTAYADGGPLPEIATITDLRFENEAQRILDIDRDSSPDRGETWRIVRPDLISSDTHISEAVLPDHLVTKTLDNHRGLDEFREHVRALCEQLPL